MRIISGSARGTILFSPLGEETRPTIDRVKEGIFSAIQFEIKDKKVLDLFSGTGQLALEALSRGASYAFLCDKSKTACDLIRKNVQKTQCSEKCEILNVDFEEALKRVKNKDIDLVFLDPPYKTQLLMNALNILCKDKFLSKNALIVCEMEKHEILPEEIGSFTLRKKYNYGKVEVCIFERMN